MSREMDWGGGEEEEEEEEEECGKAPRGGRPFAAV